MSFEWLSKMRCAISFFVGLIVASYASKAWELYDQEQQLKHDLSEPVMELSLKLYKKLCNTNNGNILFSPFSVGTSISMIEMGARGRTAEQLHKLLNRLLPDDDSFHELYQEYLETFKKLDPRYNLRFVNSIFINQNFNVIQAYTDHVSKYYFSKVTVSNFSNTEKLTNEINAHVSDSTGGQLKNLLQASELNTDTAMVLVSAIYFQGHWNFAFDKAQTSQKMFHSNKKQTRVIDMMYVDGKFAVYEDEASSFRSIELPYIGDRVSMFILLPDDIEGIENLENTLTPRLIRKLMAKRAPLPRVSLTLPKFKYVSNFDLNDILSELGMTDAFSPVMADLSGIVPQSYKLHLSHVKHKAFVEVDESGSVAAAATAHTIEKRSASFPVTFTVNHPFMFLIVDKFSGMILFMGKYTQPFTMFKHEEL